MMRLFDILSISFSPIKLGFANYFYCGNGSNPYGLCTKSPLMSQYPGVELLKATTSGSLSRFCCKAPLQIWQSTLLCLIISPDKQLVWLQKRGGTASETHLVRFCRRQLVLSPVAPVLPKSRGRLVQGTRKLAVGPCRRVAGQ